MTKKKDKKDPSKTPERSRRSVLKKLWAGLGILALAEAAVVVGAYFGKGDRGPVPRSSERFFAAGSVHDFKSGTVTAFKRGRFYLARLDDGQFVALSRKCTHLGCTVAWVGKEQRFVCPCHASAFDIRGQVLKAPAPRPLDRFPVVIENENIKVDLSRKVKSG